MMCAAGGAAPGVCVGYHICGLQHGSATPGELIAQNPAHLGRPVRPNWIQCSDVNYGKCDDNNGIKLNGYKGGNNSSSGGSNTFMR